MKQKLLKRTALLLCALVAGMSSVWAEEEVTLKAGTNGSACTVNEKDGIKVGTSSKGGNMTITVPANTTTLTLHAAAWKGVSGLSLNISGATVSPASISLTADDGISNNSPFTLSGNENDFVFSITLSDVTTETEITFTSSTTKRFVVWDASATVSSGGSGETPTCVAPTFSPAAGLYTSAQNVELSTTTEEATIHYTTDGSTPTAESSVYSSAISVSENMAIKAIAVKEGSTNSSVASATYYIVAHAGTADDPYTVADARTAIDANTGMTEVYVSGIISQIDSYSSNAITYWISEDGSTTDQFEVYKGKGLNGADFTSEGDLSVGASVVITGDIKKYNSICEFNSGSQNYNISGITCATPTFSPTAGVVTSGTIVTISTATAGATIYYTTDGSTPTTESSTYSAPIEITAATTLKAIAVKDGCTNSSVATADYTIAEPAATPTFSPAAGTYTAAQSVTINCATDGAAIYYTTDGSTPTTASSVYSGAISVSESLTIKAIAVADGYANSEVASAAYVINIPVVTWDLSIDSYSAASTTQVTWTSDYATMVVDKDKASTNANNYLPTSKSSSRFYKDSKLTITPETGYAITSIVFTATTEDYATALSGSTWTNASASASGTTVTVTPTAGNEEISATIGGTCGFTSVKVYYEEYTSAPAWSTLPSPEVNVAQTYELDLSTYVNGYPVPTITISTSVSSSLYTFSENQLSFTPTAAGEYEFTFTATNSVGSENKTLSVTAVVPTTPSIEVAATSVEAPAAGSDGMITVTYTLIESDPEIVWYTDETCVATTTEPDWISANFGTANCIEYLIGNNTGEARTAYMKVYGLDSEAEDVYSELITISQAKFYQTYTLASSVVPGKHYIIVGSNGTTYKAMGSQSTNNRKAVVVTESSNVITSADGVHEFAIYGPDANGRYTIYDEDADNTGYLYAANSNNNHLKTQATNNVNSQWVISIDGTSKAASIVAEGSNNRNVMQFNNSSSIFACYASASQSAVYLYEKDGEVAPSTEIVTVGAAGYTTMVSDFALDFTGVTAYVVSAINSGSVSLTEVTEAPANTPVIIEATEGTHNLSIVTSASAVGTNLLLASDGTVTGDGSTIYALGKKNETVGFYLVGDGVTVPAGKAYLNTSAGVKEFLGFDFNGQTAVSAVKAAAEYGVIYNLAGQRVNHAQKGIFIVNGKKVVK